MDQKDESGLGKPANLDEIVARGPSGTFAVAGLATAIIVILYFAFYLFVYLPRGAVQ